MESITEELVRKEIVKGAKQIFEKGLVQAGEGNVSMRIPNKDEFYITPTYNKYWNLKEEDIVHLNFHGTLLSEGRPPSTEYRLHVALYNARPNALCVIHTHSPYATVMSVARKEIPILLEEQVIFLGGSVHVSNFAPAHSESIGEEAMRAMRTKNGVLMANHGVLACGRNMDDTVKIAELIEKLAMIYSGAKLFDGAFEISESSCPRFMEDFEQKFSTHSEMIGKCD